MKQICNYFMKGLLLCALVFGFWFMADAGVNAMEHGINIDRTGNVELIPLTQKDDGTLNYLNVTNSTGKAIKVTFEDTTPSTAYKKGDIGLAQVYQRMRISVDTDNAMKVLEKSEKPENTSTWKVDVVIYPDLFLENNTFDELYTYAINLNPAVEMALWKGAKATAQVILPIATNLTGEMKRVRPGIITISQDVRLKHNLFGRLTVGNFTDNRIGAQMAIKYRTDNGRAEVGAQMGVTGFSAVSADEGWYIGTKMRVNASVTASYYEPHTNLQFDLSANRYVFGDYGIRGDCTRHFGEYAIGLFGIYTSGEINGGFHFAIPLPGKKWNRKGFFRVKPADYFAWTYSMVAHGKYIDEQMGKSYYTRPDENRSGGFYQPDYIRYFLIKEAKKTQSKSIK